MRRLCLISFVLFTLNTASAGFEEGNHAFATGDYAKALAEWSTLAYRGEPESQVKMGMLNEEGLGTLQNFTEAYGWYVLAALQGNDTAITALKRIEAIMTPEAIGNGIKWAEEWRLKGPFSALEPEQNTSPLGLVVTLGMHAGALELLHKGADPNQSLANGDTLLISAIGRGDLPMVRILAEAGADIDRKGKMDWPPVMLALAAKHFEIAEYLTDMGASPMSKAPDGTTVQQLAAHFDQSALLAKLGGAGFQERQDATPENLIARAREGDDPDVEMLLARGVAADSQDPNGWTPLIFAVAAGHRIMVARLIEAGANVEHVAKDGSTALMIAVAQRLPEITRLLVAAGADPSKTDETGVSPLALAGQLELEKLMPALYEALTAPLDRKPGAEKPVQQDKN